MGPAARRKPDTKRVRSSSMPPVLRRLLALGVVVLLLLGALVAFKRSRFGRSAGQALELVNAIECGKGDEAACRENHTSREARCTAGDGQGCVLLGIEAQVGKAVPKDDATARKYFQRACDLKDANGCWYYGDALARSVPKDDAKAFLAYQKGCDLGGDVNVCDSLGEAYEYGRGVAVDKTKALAAFDRGCSFGRPGAKGFVCDHATKLRAAMADGGR